MIYKYDGKKIAALREAKGWSMAELARRSGIKQPSLWAIEHQNTKKPKAETLMQIAAALGVPLKTILSKQPGTNGPDPSESLLALFSSLDQPNQQALIAAAEALLNSQKRR